MQRKVQKYGIAVSGNAAALVDLVSINVLAVVHGEHPEELIFARYPDVRENLVQKCAAEPIPDEDTAMERAILDMMGNRS